MADLFSKVIIKISQEDATRYELDDDHDAAEFIIAITKVHTIQVAPRPRRRHD